LGSAKLHAITGTMKNYCLLIPLILLALAGNGQITGTVIDSANRQPIPNALIGIVLKSNPTDTSYEFCNDKGAFNISPVPSGNFSILFSSLSYRPVAKFINQPQAQKSIALGTIVLSPLGTLLGEVTIMAAPIVIKEDTIEYRADAFKVKENAMTEDLLKKLPGVQVDKDGNVTAQGKTVTKIRVNGKDFFGGDVKTATRELPANIIDKVQVIDDYGDQATVSGIKDGDPEKIINLQIKKDKNKGFFGRATAGAGTDSRYQASLNSNYFNNTQQISVFANSNNVNQSLFSFGNGQGSGMGMSNMMRNGQRMMNDMGGGSGMMNAFNSGDQGFVSGNAGGGNGITSSHAIGTNYRDNWGKKINVYGSYSFSTRQTDILQTTATQTFFQGGSFINNQNNSTTNNNINHRFFFNMEYQIDSFNYLKISPTVTYGLSNSNAISLFDFADAGGDKTSDGRNKNFTETSTPNISATLLYNHRFRKKGRNISANVSLGTSQNNSDQNVENTTNVLTVNPPGLFSQFQQINQANRSKNYGIRLTYSEPLSKTRNLDVALSHNLNYTQNNRQAFDNNPLNPVPLPLPSLSNHFENEFYNNRAGISLRTVTKKYTYTLGLSTQPVVLMGKSLTKDSAYKTIYRVNVFPIARFTYNFTKTKSFNANYSGNATQPGFNQLQDVLDISNPQFATRGNPALKPAVNHNVNFGYNNFNIVSGRVIFTNLTLSTIQNQIVNNIIRQGSTGAQLSIPENVNGFFNATAFYLYSRPYKKRKYVLTLNGSANFNNNVNLVDSIRNIGKNWIAAQGFMLEYNYKSWLEFGMGATYSINTVRYKKPEGAGLSTLQNTNSSALVISSNIDIDFKEKWIIKYNFDYTFNYGLAAGVNRNLAILNASVERQLFKKKNGVIRLAAFDVFNQQTNIVRTVTANAIVDSRSNRLARYLLLTFTYRLQKFQGTRPRNQGIRGFQQQENKNAEIKVF
jgi:hypothetical protein